MAALRRSCEIGQSTQRFHVSCDNRCLLGNEYGGLHGCEFLGKTNIYWVGETGAQWIRNLLFQYITDPVRATGIFYSTNDNTLNDLSNSGA